MVGKVEDEEDKSPSWDAAATRCLIVESAGCAMVVLMTDVTESRVERESRKYASQQSSVM